MVLWHSYFQGLTVFVWSPWQQKDIAELEKIQYENQRAIEVKGSAYLLYYCIKRNEIWCCNIFKGVLSCLSFSFWSNEVIFQTNEGDMFQLFGFGINYIAIWFSCCTEKNSWYVVNNQCTTKWGEIGLTMLAERVWSDMMETF